MASKLRLVAFGLAVLSAACTPAPSSGLRCSADVECASGLACVDGRCMERVDLDLDAGAPFDAGDPADEQDAGRDGGAPSDAGALPDDAGALDAGVVDAGAPDSGASDAGTVDAGTVDAGNIDAGNVDAGNVDAGNVDAGAQPGTGCGDGDLGVGEACDDRNLDDRDGCSRACRTWWDEDFTLRARVSLGNPTPPLVDVPVLVTVPVSVPDGPAPGEKVCFVDDDHVTSLAWELDGIDATTGYPRFWVRVPHLASGSEDAVWLYTGYTGSSQAPCGIDPVDTWSAYRSVWHLDDELDDASRGEADLTNHGTTPVEGVVGGARECAPSTAWLSHDGSASPKLRGDATLEAWVRLDVVNGSFGNQFLIHTANAQDLESPDVNVLYSLRYDDPNGIVTYWEHGDGIDEDPTTGGAIDVAVGGWHHYAVTRDEAAQAVRFYLDGTLLETMPYGANPTDGENGRLFVCGHPQFATRGLDGAIDEVRLSADVKSSDWLRVSALAAQGSLATVGPLAGN